MKTVLRVFLFLLLFGASFYLYLDNIKLKNKLDYITERVDEVEEKTEILEITTDALTEVADDFHSNLYAQTNSLSNDGAHLLYISDIYYRKNFKKENDK